MLSPRLFLLFACLPRGQLCTASGAGAAARPSGHTTPAVVHTFSLTALSRPSSNQSLAQCSVHHVHLVPLTGGKKPSMMLRPYMCRRFGARTLSCSSCPARTCCHWLGPSTTSIAASVARTHAACRDHRRDGTCGRAASRCRTCCGTRRRDPVCRG